MPAAGPALPGVGLGSGVQREETGCSLMGLSPSDRPQDRTLRPTCSHLTHRGTKRQRVSEECRLQWRGVYPGQDPQEQPLHTRSPGRGLSPRTNDSVCGEDHDTGRMEGWGQGPLLSTVSTAFTAPFLWCVLVGQENSINIKIKLAHGIYFWVARNTAV